MLFSGMLLGWSRAGELLRGRVVHHQPMPRSTKTRIAIYDNFEADKVTLLFLTSGLRPLISDICRSHGRTMRNRSIGTEIFFNSVGPNFSNRASSAFRIWRSTSIDTQIPPAPDNGSIRDAMFTPSP